LSSTLLEEKLVSGVRSLGEDPGQFPIDTYLDYIREIQHWNKAYNLTAIRDLDTMVTHHILDSLSILPYIKGERCLDVGSGAGLPGFVLALAKPRQKWVLLDSKLKKIRFLNHILYKFKPQNVEIVHARAEEYRPGQGFTTIVTRALSSLSGFYGMTAHLGNKTCHWLAMKGSYPVDELSEFELRDKTVVKLEIPEVSAERYLVIMK
jgi:16S rRNA (guanine527-N7)-methyltransferase